jgi:tetratricopeptide (TPR) repeat protein
VTAERGSDRRAVVPRWRSWLKTDRSGELRPLRPSATPKIALTSDPLAEPTTNFQAHPGVHAASDLIASALVVGKVTDEAIRAAHYVMAQQEAPTPVVFLAESLLAGEQTTNDAQLSEATDEARRERVSRLKSILRREPRNSVRWVDLAWVYTALGQPLSAEHAMRIALNLGRPNRFVLRAANRFEIHRNDFEKAASLLNRDPGRLEDPWLLSAEIATQSLLERTSKHIKIARRIVDRGGFAPWHVGELASALATVELSGGQNRSARKLLKLALREPTENAVAQVEWSAPEMVQPDQLKLPFGFEVRARHAAREARWTEAVAFGIEWLKDQPFSFDAAAHTSFIASVEAEDYASAELAAALGLRTNKHSILLLNNLAFALANQMKLDKARESLDLAASLEGNEHDRALLTATRGLVAFRSGRQEEGRNLYKSAIDQFRSDNHLIALCTAFWAREEVLAHTEFAEGALSQAESASKRAKDEETGRLVDRVRRLMKESSVGRHVSSFIGKMQR